MAFRGDSYLRRPYHVVPNSYKGVITRKKGEKAKKMAATKAAKAAKKAGSD